jgi:hypothetical protein
MKNLIIGFLFLITASLMSQTPGRFELGGYLGFENNFISCDNPEVINRYRSIPGFNIGFRMEFHFNRFISMVGGIEYTDVQFRFLPPPQDPNNPIFWSNGILKYDVARVPILFQLNVGSKRSRFLFNVGPILMASIVDRNNADTYGLLPEVLSEINFGGDAGIGYAYFPTTWFKIYIETYCVIPFWGTPYSAYTTPTSVRNIGFGGRVGVSFRLRKPQE